MDAVTLAFPFLIGLILVALAFDFLNGMNDAANSIATVVSTRVLKPHWAVAWAAFFNFIAFLFFGLHVAETIGRGIIDASIVDPRVIFGALTGAIVWQIVTNRLGIPSSSSHALIGGLVGAGIAKAGFSAVVWSGVIKTVSGIVLAKLLVHPLAVGFFLWQLGPVEVGLQISGVILAAMPMLAVLMVGGWVQAHGGNQFTSAHGRPLTVSLIQTNVPQNEKFDVAHMVRQLSWLQDVLLSSQAQLTVAPETAIPLLPAQLPEGYWSHLTHYFSMPERSALLGVPLGSYEDGYTNSVAGLSGGSAAGADAFYRYNKHHLVPFGEFIPVGFHWFVAMMNIPLGDFTRGPRNAPSFVVADQRIAPTICYEDLFGEELADRFVAEDASLAPTMFANVSNLAWFGKTVAIYQHLQIARFRSLEFQRPTIRSTNTGATVVIDHLGRVAAMLPTNTQGVLQAAVQGRVGVTPYAAWVGRLGLWPLVAFAVLGIGLLRRR
mgnify:CR=1 FL=1